MNREMSEYLLLHMYSYMVAGDGVGSRALGSQYVRPPEPLPMSVVL